MLEVVHVLDQFSVSAQRVRRYMVQAVADRRMLLSAGAALTIKFLVF